MMKATGTILGELQMLEELLDELARLHHALLETVQAKLAAMRRADADGMTASVAREGDLLKDIQQCEGRRRQAMIAVGRGLGIEPRRAATLSLSELMGQIDPTHANRFDQVRKQLLSCVEQLGKANTFCRLLAERMISCHRTLFEEATRSAPAQAVYDLGGRPRTAPAAQVLDAKG